MAGREQRARRVGSVRMDHGKGSAGQAVRSWVRGHGPLLASVAVAAVWSALALATPRRTYHFAPALAVAAWPATLRALGGRAAWSSGLRAAASGLLIGLSVALALHLADALAGPSLVGGSALVESTVGAVLGAVWGLHLAVRSRPGDHIAKESNTHEGR